MPTRVAINGIGGAVLRSAIERDAALDVVAIGGYANRLVELAERVLAPVPAPA